MIPIKCFHPIVDDYWKLYPSDNYVVQSSIHNVSNMNQILILDAKTAWTLYSIHQSSHSQSRVIIWPPLTRS